MKKTLALLLAALLMAAAFAGCGSQPAAQPAAQPDDQSAAAEPAAPADSQEVISLGFLSPITGPNAAEGAAARNAFQLAIDQANASGEYPYTINVLIMDDQSDPSVGVAGAQKIVADDTVVAATGHWNSGVAEATIPVFKEAEIPFLIWGAIRESLTSAENYPWVTRSAPTDVQENVPLAKAVLDDMGYSKIFIVSDTTSYGAGNTAAFKAELASRGLEPLGVEEVQEGTVDFRAILSKVKNSGADCVYWGGVVTEGSLLKQQMYEEGVNALFCGISGNYSEDFLKISPEAAEGALIVKPGIVLESTEAGKKFVEDYNAAGFSEPIGAYTPYAYEAALILLQALKTCGDAPTAEAMRDAIKDGEFHGIMGTTTFSEIGQTTLVAAYLNVVQDGAWTVYDDSEYAAGTRTFPGK
ncbi:MAG: branched-chain amino acid ABC transporter substrate-binding protein [Clostridia bacterium]|nr:branched-chain amino acid ABC transporter substrate-binding protein [Candidatus Pelethousia sp.]NCB30368.1 branched-chain amino acid ABC transporter substrate-binding protein [Clostridia bacterium]